MGMTDPIADMLTRIRNGRKAKFSKVDIPCSRVKTEIAQVMKAEGYIKHYKVIKDTKQGLLRVYLKYDDNHRSAFIGVERVSKPGRRIYVKSKDVKPIMNGMGIAIISTSQGFLTDKQVKERNIGGEFVCKIW
jgi:small subunit ribosomal protein S8